MSKVGNVKYLGKKCQASRSTGVGKPPFHLAGPYSSVWEVGVEYLKVPPILLSTLRYLTLLTLR